MGRYHQYLYTTKQRQVGWLMDVGAQAFINIKFPITLYAGINVGYQEDTDFVSVAHEFTADIGYKNYSAGIGYTDMEEAQVIRFFIKMVGF